MLDPTPPPAPVVQDPPPITYKLVEDGSRQGKDILVDSVGYRYAQKVDKRRAAVTWRCTVRSKALTCKATVLERDGGYVRGRQDHICQAQPGREVAAIVSRELCRKLMALPLLPEEHIRATYGKLLAEVPADSPLANVFDYFRDTWIDGRVFTPTDWSVYRQPIRTNNDVEGWHYRLNHRGKKAKLHVYLFIKLLHKEARLVHLTSQFIYREDVTRMQKAGSSRTTANLFKLWDEYHALDRTTLSLLRAVLKQTIKV